MNTELLSTKLFIPQPISGLVMRPRLLTRLEGVLTHKLTLVSAPAGFGKTTLLSQWVQGSHIPTAWLLLEEAENDPIRFWRYFIAALRTVQAGIGETAQSWLGLPQPVPIESTLTTLINDLTSFSDDFVLVLDDYHVISSEIVNKSVSFLIDHLPPRLHLVILSRADPPMPVARFRGKGMLSEIRTDDLRFALEEAAELLSLLGVASLPTGSVEILNAKIEGWVAGLKMASLSMRERKNVTAFVADFAGNQRYIMDYLLAEVLERQTKDVRTFLLQTSVLERLTGPLCDAVTQRSDGPEMLHLLERMNLFVVPLDASGEWYRYHGLFANLLRNRLALESGADMGYELHRRASHWYEEKGLAEDAVNHAISARDWERAMTLISQPGILALRATTITLLNWLRQIPEDLLRTNVELYINYIWALVGAGRYSTADNCLNYLDTVAGNNQHLQGRIANIRATVAGEKGDFHLTEELARKALSLLDPESLIEHITVSALLAIVLIQRFRFSEAETLFKQILASSRLTGIAQQTIFPLTYLGLISWVKGELHQSADLLREAIKIAHPRAPTLAGTYNYLSQVHYEWNDLKTAAEYNQREIDLLRLLRKPELHEAYLFLARIRAAQGDTHGTLEAFENADRLLAEGEPDAARRTRNIAYHATAAIIEGNSAAALKWADELLNSDISPLVGLPVPAKRLVLSIKMGRSLKAQYDSDYQQFEQEGLRSLMIAVRISQALDSPGPGTPMDYIAEALAMGRPEGFIRMFVDFGMELVPLLRQAVARGFEPEYARQLIDIIKAENRRRKVARAKGHPVSSSSGLLSERELDVLRLVAEGLPNQQIAARLIISVSTTKNHVHNIIEKLGVQSRTQAVTQASELGLI